MHLYNVINWFQVAQEIWICENETVTKWKGNILDYKDHLKKRISKETTPTPAPSASVAARKK